MGISIIFGGASYEHEISIVSAVAIKKTLGAHIGHYIFLDGEHRFWLIPHTEMKSSFFAKGLYKTKAKELFVANGGFYHPQGVFNKPKILKTGILYSLIHGADGEDGVLSALCEIFAIPYIAPRVQACVLSFDKALTKLFAAQRGVLTLQSQILTQNQTPHLTIPYPVIIKPTRLGSSLGVSVATNESELRYGLDSAFEYDTRVLIEPFIQDVKEYNLAGCKVGNEWIFSLIEEPRKKQFLNFEDKYLDFARTEQVLRADISSELEREIQENFKKIYADAFEGALIRCDFFVIDNRVYLNEINPIPGSGAHYLFENFPSTLQALSENLPSSKRIKPSYKYIEQIQRAKGK